VVGTDVSEERVTSIFRGVVVVGTDVSEERVASIFRSQKTTFFIDIAVKTSNLTSPQTLIFNFYLWYVSQDILVCVYLHINARSTVQNTINLNRK
jgi:hypothetical protein